MPVRFFVISSIAGYNIFSRLSSGGNMVSIRNEWNEYSNMFCKINSVNSFGYLYNATAKTLSFGGGASSEIIFKR